MATTKTLTGAIPYENASNEVVRWDLKMKYENDSEGDVTYFTSKFFKEVLAPSDFTAAAKGTFNLAALTALCPISIWDTVFASQVDSVITNPSTEPVADTDFVIPS